MQPQPLFKFPSVLLGIVKDWPETTVLNAARIAEQNGYVLAIRDGQAGIFKTKPDGWTLIAVSTKGEL